MQIRGKALVFFAGTFLVNLLLVGHFFFTRSTTTTTTTRPTCRERAAAGENVLLEAVLKRDDRTGFTKDLIVERGWNHAKSDVFDDLADITFRTVSGRCDVDYGMVSAIEGKHGGATIVLLKNSACMCSLLDPAQRQVLSPSALILVLGPFGDGDNFGSFSSVENSFVKNVVWGKRIRRECKSQYDVDAALRTFLNDSRLVAWVSIAGGLNHPKILYYPIGFNKVFWEAVREQGVPKKEDFIAVTWRYPLPAKYSDFRDRVYEHISNRFPNRFTTSPIDPFKDKRLRKEERWKLATEQFIRAKLIPAPAGLGAATKRPMEAILTGGVGIVSVDAGDLSTWYGLPVIYVNDMLNLPSADVLNEAYLDAVCDVSKRKFEMLTSRGWIDYLTKLAKPASAELRELYARSYLII